MARQTGIERALKEGGKHLLREWGPSSTDAIRLFYKQVELRSGLPFAV
jgi:antitoxin component of RelBE/YafQ-DinJ toxin-antitoxin module